MPGVTDLERRHEHFENQKPGFIAEAARRALSRRIVFGWPLVEFLRRPLAALPAAGFGMTGGWGAVAPDVLVRRAFAIAGSQHNLKFIEFIPLGLGPQPFWNLQKRLQALTRGKGLWFVHGGIISSFGHDGLILLPILLFSALFFATGADARFVADG